MTGPTLGAWAAEGRALQTDRSGLFFAAFLPNTQILDCKIVKNCPRWGQFSLRRVLPPRLLGGYTGQADPWCQCVDRHGAGLKHVNRARLHR